MSACQGKHRSSTKLYSQQTVINQISANLLSAARPRRLLQIKYRPLNRFNSQLTYAHLASRQPGDGARTPEIAPDTVGVGDNDEAGSSSEVDLISRWHGQRKEIRPKNVEERQEQRASQIPPGTQVEMIRDIHTYMSPQAN